MRLFLFIILLSKSLWAAPVDDFKMRVTWVKTLKQLFLEIENRPPYELVEHEKKFLESYSLIQRAWAETDSRYNCFYGGWPSVRKGKYCQNPSRVNTSYDKGACQSNELQCQPLLFGKGLCVPGATQADRNRSFTTCDKKFKKEKNGSHDFLRSLSDKEAQDLQELSLVASDVCLEKSQKQPGTCKMILEKLSDGLKSIEKGRSAPEPDPVLTSSPQLPQVTPRTRDSVADNEDCLEQENIFPIQPKRVRSLQTIATSNVDKMYEEMKADFQKSPMCDPSSVVSDPNEKPSPVIVSKFYYDLSYIDLASSGSSFRKTLKKLQEYGVSESVAAEVLPMFEEFSRMSKTDERRETLKLRAKSLLVQDFFKNYRHDSMFMREEIKKELANKNIFKRNDRGEIECPFVTKDAFLKALAGRDEVLKSHQGGLKNRNQLTIVDYSRPSNERRLFVLDLESKKVLHNTWVAHGSGGDRDDLGSSPRMSNQSGSNMSSDGFIIAGAASHGSRFGPNVVLKGIDKNNSNLARRAVIVHKWPAPYDDYATGAQDYDRKNKSYGLTYDINEKIKKTDFRKATKEEMKNTLAGLYRSVYVPNTVQPTQGCLGVPLNNVRHLDRKGRNISQLEALRQDLPGSLIFNYSGPEMTSKYF